MNPMSLHYQLQLLSFQFMAVYSFNSVANINISVDKSTEPFIFHRFCWIPTY